ncbi:methyltransferase domain protein [Campylobacter rectus RM3267]|uniref:tRNA m6A37 methyltransferase TrmN6 n=2 Tax=Campylobacter rectus TaxID=203 RepID=A0A6G5QMK7_CAMRE|nr:methyltransferase [Campylobacter rectus]EEF14056.1 methyltransferase domain protein [Campylobacter rectus RM3267]QCD46938.1 tRNA m6A37 methyltransferase TrmN6 [Campylobacter rectus]UEB47636.1 methyltransferase [Campylobacter rectus]
MIITQPKNGYRYNSDTMFLYDFIREGGARGEVLDVGCGSGVLGLLLKRDFPKISLSLLDILEANVNLAAANASQNGLEAEFITADFAKFKSEKRFDLIVSNPPFYHDGVKKSENEHLRTSRYSENLPLSALVRTANSLLKPRGVFSFCYDAKRLAEILLCLSEFKFTLTRLCFVYPKTDGTANLALIEAKKSSKSLAQILPPIFVFEGGVYSKKAVEIFATANTQSKDALE